MSESSKSSKSSDTAARERAAATARSGPGSEYPPERSAYDGTGVTQAVCPKGHGKERTVSADALSVKGAPDTIALRCWEKLSDAEAKKAPMPPQTGALSRPSREFSPGASNAPILDTDKCQEYLVPVESFNERGEQVRKGGKKLDKPAETKESKRRASGLVDDDTGEKRAATGGAYQETGAGTGGEKLAAASGVDGKASKKSARSSASSSKKSTAKKSSKKRAA